MKSILLITLVLLQLPLLGQQKADTAFVFRFVPNQSIFYVPYNGNGAELDRLLDSIAVHSNEIAAGQIYLSVSSYAPRASGSTSAERMGYLQSSRVKSELIIRGGVTERNFVTDRMFMTPFADSLRNVVVVTFPAGVEKVARIAGPEAAAKVKDYLAQVAANSPEARRAAQAQADKEAREAAAKEATARRAHEERVAAAARHKAEQAAAEEEARAEAERQRLAAAELARLQSKATDSPYTLALRANLLRWATLTLDLGVEWRISPVWGVALDGTWTSLSFDKQNQHYALWEASPSIHYYIGKQKRGYVGAMCHIGQFNYKLSDTGKQGDLLGGGLMAGYKLPIGKSLVIDFNLGVGYTHAQYSTYTVTDGVHMRRGDEAKNYWGINKAGVTLVWKLL